MSKASTYATATPVDGDKLLGTDDPAGTPATKNFLVEAIATYVGAKLHAYSGLSVANNAVAQTGITATPAVLTAFDTVLPESNVTGDHTANTLTVDAGVATGDYLIAASFSFSGSNNATFAFELFKNNVATGLKMDRKLGTGGDVGSSGFNGLLELAAGDVLDVRVSGDGATVTVSNAQIVVTKQ